MPTKTTSRVRDSGGRFLPGHSVGVDTRWRGVSGNPAGTPRNRRAFEESFFLALVGEGTPQEAARLLWECARAKEPWAITALLARLAPAEARLRITPETNRNDTYDLTRLTDAELEQLATIAARAAGGDTATRVIEGGDGPPEVPSLR
jgi:hypothetical protein